MELYIKQNVKEEINKNLSLHVKLLELIKLTKTSNDNAELDDSFIKLIYSEFKTRKYAFEDLICYIPKLVSDKLINENENTLLIQTLCAVNNKNEDYFSDDSNDLKALIKACFLEISPLTPSERESCFATIASDKYLLYIWQRAFSLLDVVNPLLDY